MRIHCRPKLKETNLLSLIPKIAFPWDDVNDPVYTLFYAAHSNEKRVSQMAAGMLGENHTATDAQLKLIADVISMTYAARWRRDWATLDMDYDPIENYNLIEDGSETRTPDTTTTTTRTPETTTTTTTTPNTTTTTTRTPDTTTTTTPNTTKATTYDGYKETDALAFDGRTDKRDTTDTPASVTETETWDGYHEAESETVPGRTDARTASSKTNRHDVNAYNSTTLIPESSDTGAETWTDTTTAGAAGQKTKDITGTHTRVTATTAPGSGSDALTKSGTETHTITKDGTETEAETGTVTVTETGTDTTTATTSGTDTTTVTTSGTDTTTATTSGTDATKHDLHRHGNIGVTTTQQMIAAEREINRYAFYEQVANDIDEILTARVYLLSDME